MRLSHCMYVALTLLLLASGLVLAQEAEAPATPRAAPLPRWMPRPSRYLDHPMTETEYQYCLLRTDIPKRGGHGHPVGDEPPAPRRLLDERVSVEVNGTVVQALGTLMGPSQREWLAGIRGDSADKVSQLALKDAPLWQALDELLEAYGYDWGYVYGAVVCWPALIPARVRSDTPDVVPAGESPEPAAQPFEIAEPTPIDTVLNHYRPAHYPWEPDMTLNRRVALDERLRDWKLVGRMATAGTVRGIYQVAAALPAVVQGDAFEGCVTMGAHMWLDRAMRGADARAVELQAQIAAHGSEYLSPALKAGGMRVEEDRLYRLLLIERLRGMLTPQHWALMDIGGEAVMWFRELPLDVAEWWVVTARIGEARRARAKAAPGPDQSVDWSRPEDFYVRAYYADEVAKSTDDGLYRVVGRCVGIAPSVPTKGGDRSLL